MDLFMVAWTSWTSLALGTACTPRYLGTYLRFAIVQRTMAEVGVGRPTARARARALVLESTEIISQVRALIQTNL